MWSWDTPVKPSKVSETSCESRPGNEKSDVIKVLLELEYEAA